MQLKFFPVLLFFLTFILSCSSSTNSNDVLDDEHFDFVLYDGLTSTNIMEISEELENNYKRIIDDLQVQSMPKVTVKIWADYNNFLGAMETDIGIRYTGATGYIFGMTEFRIYYTTQAPVAAVHEFAHLASLASK